MNVSIFDRFFTKKQAAPVEKKSAQIVSTFRSNSFLGMALSGARITPFQALEFYRESAAVATAVDMICDEVEQIVPVIIGPDGGMLDTHPVLELLRKPNPAQDQRNFISVLAHMWLLTRDCFVVAEGNKNLLPIHLWSVKTPNVSVTENGTDRYPESFFVSNGPGGNDYVRTEEKRKWRFLANNYAELCRITGFSSLSSSSFPDSPLQAAALEVEQQVMGRNHNLNLLSNGGRLSLVATFKDTLDADMHEQRSRDLQRDLGGAANAGKIAVISSQDMEIKEFGMHNKDMDYIDLDKISATAIYLRYKIPLPLISNEASTYNNMEQAKFDLYDRAVIPTFNVIAEGLTNFLMPRMGLDPREYRISFNPETIIALRGRLLSELKIRKDLNIETVNELRSLLPNREPLTEGGDKLYQPGTLVPIADDLSTEDNLASLTERAKEKLNGQG